MSRYSKIKLGDVAKIHHKITKIDIEKFVDLSGDDNRLHVDEEFASKTTFKKPVAHGMLGASFISTIIGTKIPGDGALWYSQSLEFLLPVRVGDALEIVATVTKKSDRQNSIELQTDIFNQNKQLVTTGLAKVKVIEDETPKTLNSTDVDKSHEKMALILGATGGIGSTTATELAKEGYGLILHYNSNKLKAQELKIKLKKLTKKRIIIVKANLLKESEISEMFTEVNRYTSKITVLINASTLNFGNIKLERLEWTDIESQLNITIKSAFLLVKSILPFMDGYGKMVFITSSAAEQFPGELIHYITAKSALNGFVKALAIELASKGIRVNLVSPGMTNTDLISDVPDMSKLLTAAKTPLKKLAEPIDVANAISYLASNKSDFITGETIRVNGGQVLL